MGMGMVTGRWGGDISDDSFKRGRDEGSYSYLCICLWDMDMDMETGMGDGMVGKEVLIDQTTYYTHFEDGPLGK